MTAISGSLPAQAATQQIRPNSVRTPQSPPRGAPEFDSAGRPPRPHMISWYVRQRGFPRTRRRLRAGPEIGRDQRFSCSNTAPPFLDASALGGEELGAMSAVVQGGVHSLPGWNSVQVEETAPGKQGRHLAVVLRRQGSSACRRRPLNKRHRSTDGISAGRRCLQGLWPGGDLRLVEDLVDGEPVSTRYVNIRVTTTPEPLLVARRRHWSGNPTAHSVTNW